MFNNSVVLAPNVGSSYVGGPFPLYCRLESSGTTQSSYFMPIMGLFNAQRERQESDNRSSGSASGTHHHGGEVNCSVSNARSTQTPSSRARGRSSHGSTPNMHINNAVERSGQPRVMEVDSSRAIVEDYIRYCLQKQGITWENGQRDVTPSAPQRAMRALGDELEDRFSETIDAMVNRLQFTPENGQERLSTVMEEIFADGVAWGRIAALVEFAGKLSARCVQQSRPQLVYSIVDWVSIFVDTRLRSWIVENSGWEGFVKFYEDPDKHSKESWSSLKKLFTVGAAAGAAAVGLLTLGALLKS